MCKSLGRWQPGLLPCAAQSLCWATGARKYNQYLKPAESKEWNVKKQLFHKHDLLQVWNNWETGSWQIAAAEPWTALMEEGLEDGPGWGSLFWVEGGVPLSWVAVLPSDCPHSLSWMSPVRVTWALTTSLMNKQTGSDCFGARAKLKALPFKALPHYCLWSISNKSTWAKNATKEIVHVSAVTLKLNMTKGCCARLVTWKGTVLTWGFPGTHQTLCIAGSWTLKEPEKRAVSLV